MRDPGLAGPVDLSRRDDIVVYGNALHQAEAERFDSRNRCPQHRIPSHRKVYSHRGSPQGTQGAPRDFHQYIVTVWGAGRIGRPTGFGQLGVHTVQLLALGRSLDFSVQRGLHRASRPRPGPLSGPPGPRHALQLTKCHRSGDCPACPAYNRPRMSQPGAIISSMRSTSLTFSPHVEQWLSISSG